MKRKDFVDAEIWELVRLYVKQHTLIFARELSVQRPQRRLTLSPGKPAFFVLCNSGILSLGLGFRRSELSGLASCLGKL